MESQKNSKDDDKEFIEGVWQKVRYLEYIKQEEETIKENNKYLFLVRIKTALCLLAVAILFAVPLLMTEGVNIFTIIVIGSVLLSEGIIYEYIQSICILRGNRHEN